MKIFLVIIFVHNCFYLMSCCPSLCKCNGTSVDCNNLGLTDIGLIIKDVSISTTKLYLNGNNIAKIEQSTFGVLPSLTYLDLSQNVIANIGENAFGGLTSLTYLNLNGNSLIVTGNIFQNLTTLTTLELSMIKISKIKRSTFGSLPNLTKLHMQSCSISSIESGSFHGLNKLKDLYLSYNTLTKIERSTFEELTSLTNLHLTGNSIARLEEDLNLTKLAYLGLAENNMSSIERSSFENLQSLNRLDLRRNQINLIESRSFEKIENLQHLYLSENKITEIAKSTFGQLRNLLQLDLNQNNITKIESGVFESLTSLTYLNLLGNKITQIEGSNFRNLTNLIYLYLGNLESCTCSVLIDFVKLREGNVNLGSSSCYIGKQLIKFNFEEKTTYDKCGQPEWATWMKLAECIPKNNKTIVPYKRKCFSYTGTDNPNNCIGNNTKEENCNANTNPPFSKSEINKAKAVVILQHLTQNGVSVSVEELKASFIAHGLLYAQFESDLREALLHLYKSFNQYVTNIVIMNRAITNSFKFTYVIVVNSYNQTLSDLYVHINSTNVFRSPSLFAATIKGNLITTDYNECLEDKDTCDQNAHCALLTNTISYGCQCKENYAGNGVTCNKDSPQWSEWKKYAECITMDGRTITPYKRRCRTSYMMEKPGKCIGQMTKSEACNSDEHPLFSRSKISKAIGDIVLQQFAFNGIEVSNASLTALLIKKGSTYYKLKKECEESLLSIYKEIDQNVTNITIVGMTVGSLKISHIVVLKSNNQKPIDVNATNDDEVSFFHPSSIFSAKMSKRNLTLTDYNECEEDEDACDKNAYCVIIPNTYSYGCQCKDLYQGDGFQCEMIAFTVSPGKLSKTVIVVICIAVVIFLVVIVVIVSYYWRQMRRNKPTRSVKLESSGVDVLMLS